MVLVHSKQFGWETAKPWVADTILHHHLNIAQPLVIKYTRKVDSSISVQRMQLVIREVILQGGRRGS